MSLKEQASRAISLLALYEVEGNSIERIISIVQNNQKYFGVRLGNSAIEAAANKLEQLVSEAAEHSVQSDGAGTLPESGEYFVEYVESNIVRLTPRR